MEMFWEFQKGIIHVSIPNGFRVGSYNQKGLIFVLRPFGAFSIQERFYSRASYNNENMVCTRHSDYDSYATYGINQTF